MSTSIPKEVKIEDVEVWFQDETRVGQQGSISRTWYLKGERPRLVKQQQFLSAYIYGAVCPAKDKSSAIFASEALLNKYSIIEEMNINREFSHVRSL